MEHNRIVVELMVSHKEHEAVQENCLGEIVLSAGIGFITGNPRLPGR